MKYLLALLSICIVACNPVTPGGRARFETNPEDSAKIAELFARTKTNRDSANYFIQQAKAIADTSRTSKLQVLFSVLLGKELVLTGQLDSADAIADSGLQLAYNQADLNLKGKFYNLKGQIQGLRKNPYPSIDYYLKAEKIFLEASDSGSLAGIYSNIANAYFSLKDYKTAHQFAAKAYGLKNAVKDASIKANLTTIYALSLIKIQDTKKALLIEREVDSMATATNNIMAKIAATIGFAEIYKTARQFDTAIAYYKDCIALSRKTGVKHFELMSNVGLLSLYEETGQTQEIIALSDSTLLLAKMLNNTDILHTTKRIIGRAFAKQNNFKRGFQLLNESYNLYDSSAGIENQKNINELLVKYDAEKKEKEILNQNLLLAMQETKLRNRQIIILSLVLGLAILTIVYFYVRKLNRERLMRLEIEKKKKIGDAYIHGEQKERTRLALEIHDGIASMLTGITYKLRAEDANKNEVIQLLTGLHEDTRRISHSLMPVDFEQKNLAEAVQSLCEKMTTGQVEVIFASTISSIELDEQKSLLLYRLIQELINNALKYAQCKSVFVRLGSKDATLNISVEDDGIGLPDEVRTHGFTSIRKRIKSLGANLSIESVAQEGTTIKITCKNE
jgi:two-component system NarL family sensor kinase